MGSIKQRMVQNAFGPVHESPHTTCLKITHRVIILAPAGSRGHTKDWTVFFGKRTLPIGFKGRGCDRMGSGLASVFKPCPRLRQAPSSGMVLLMVANILRLSQVTHAGLATRDVTCHPPLRGLVSPQNWTYRHLLRALLSREWCKMHWVLVHNSLHSTCLKITHRVMILAPGGSIGHTKDWTVALENGPFPLAVSYVIFDRKEQVAAMVA